MTTIETVSDRKSPDPTPGEASLGPDSVARGHLVLAPVFLLAGLAAYLVVAVKLVEPGFLDGSAFLSYGRLFPMATGLLLWGWLTPALLGAAFAIVPRMAGVPLQLRPLALGSLVLVPGGTAAGVVAVGAGHSAGGRLLELPPWADLIMLAGFALAALSVTATARGGDRARLPTAQWYLVAATWWLVLAAAVGKIVPFLDGLAAALTGWFSATAVVGLWLVAAGLGVAYYLVERLAPGAAFHPTLGRIGFWSIAFAWAWTAPRVLQYGPTPNWLETTPVVFSLAVAVAGITIVADFMAALRGRWPAVWGSLPLKLTIGGLGLFALMPVQMLVQSFRGSSAVVHFTTWEAAFEQLVVFGPVTLWAFAAISHLLPAIGGGGWSRVLGRAHLGLFGSGLLTLLFAGWVAGLQQGYTWIGAVNSQAYPNSGAGFRNSVAPLDGLRWAQVVALGAMLLAVLAFLVPAIRNGVGRASGSGDPPLPPSAGAATQRLGIVLQGAVLLFAVAAAGVVLVPLYDADTAPSLLAEDTRDFAQGSLEARGRELYVREGCWYCHTQQVRAAVTDVGLGAVSDPGDYAFDEADVLGLERIGPDLAHVGGRIAGGEEWEGASPAGYLADPGAGRPWSVMPPYDHLPAADLEALAAYLAALE
ncbi:MAG TPA: cbb3-type cytochrome c oxidase subunit I [Gemmatimonadales bacterium]|nr:cbb3-type cytochrome c oxidase subunit I [Gemmatimonadales bacterium]